MAKLNLGCGNDVKPGYVNADFRKTHPSVEQVDLSKFPWPWSDGAFSEVLMLDFLEHFEHSKTDSILQEAWRVLELKGALVVQVPDFLQCSRAASNTGEYHCNSCGFWIADHEYYECEKCGKDHLDIARDAIKRLYGGQDYVGNYHMTGFTRALLVDALEKNGFAAQEFLEEDHQRLNWNFKISAKKAEDLW